MSDLISRQDAILAIEDMPNAYNGWSDTYDKACIIGVLEELPSADRPTGEWVDDCTCSICHWMHEDNNGFALITKYNYCPNCGARMRGENDDD